MSNVMQATEYRVATDDIIYLCSCAVNSVLPDKNRVAAMNLDGLIKDASRHMLAAMIGQTLQTMGISTPSFKSAISQAQRKAVTLNYEYLQVSAALENAGIWYMPLKGAIIKDLYSRFAMGEMSDYDILFDASRATDVKNIMVEQGFKVKTFGIGPDDSYIKPPVTNFEMHTALFGDKHDEKLQGYYRNVKDHLLKDEGNNYGYHFSPEDFYIYLIAHEHKHFQGGGSGLRSLLDTFVYLSSTDLDLNYYSGDKI